MSNEELSFASFYMRWVISSSEKREEYAQASKARKGKVSSHKEGFLAGKGTAVLLGA